MKFECPQCSQRLSAEPEMAGRQIACPACTNTITIPSEFVMEALTSLAPALPALVLEVPNPEASTSLVATEIQPRKSRVPVMAIAAGIVLLLAAAVAFAFSRGNGVS